MLKRLFDVLISSIVLLFVGPFLLVAAVLIRLTSPGPALYRGKRAGLGGVPFEQLKLRTMIDGSDKTGSAITEADDARITGIGKLLRATKLDEMPQFWNVLRGEMSIVGPRPESFDIVEEHYTPEFRRTLDVRPGITSEAMVIWYPDETYYDPPPDGADMERYYVERHLPVKMIEELRYVEKHGLWFDLGVILRTAYCVVVHSFLPPRKKPFPAPPDSSSDSAESP